MYRWISCSCGYKECKAKLSVKPHGQLVCVDVIDTNGCSCEIFLSVEKAKAFLSDLERVIEMVEGRKQKFEEVDSGESC